MSKIGTLNNSYKGIFDCVKRVVTEEGFRALWKGNGANFLKYFPA